MSEYESERLKEVLVKKLSGRKSLSQQLATIVEFRDEYADKCNWSVEGFAIQHLSESIGPYGVMKAYLDIEDKVLMSKDQMLLKICGKMILPSFVIHAASLALNLDCQFHPFSENERKQICKFVLAFFTTNEKAEFFKANPTFHFQIQGELL